MWLPEQDGDDPDDAELIDDTEAGAGPGGQVGPTDCGIAPGPVLQDWSVASTGTASLIGPGQGEVELWIVATARIGSEVVHWRQGPYEASAESVEVTVALPSNIRDNPLAASKKGTLSARVVAQDGEGQIVGRWSLPRLAWTLQGALEGRPVMARVSELPAPAVLVLDGETLVSADL